MPNEPVEISVSIKDMDAVISYMVEMSRVADALDTGEISASEGAERIREIVDQWTATESNN